MTRLMLTLAALMSSVSVVSATLTPRKETSPREKLPVLGNEVLRVRVAKRTAQPPVQAAGQETRSEYVLTRQTEVLLNGKPCKYENVPADARIVRMEVAADKKTVLKIHFRTGK